MILKNKFFYFLIFNLFDKLLIFLLPLSVLFFFKDKNLYNQVEIIYTISMIFYIFADGGIKNYSLAHFRKAQNSKKFINEKLNYINTLILYYLVIFFPLILFFFLLKKISVIYFLILFRLLFLIFNNYLKVHYSLLNKQLSMLKFTLASSMATLLYILYISYSHNFLSLEEFFMFQIFITVALIIYNIFNNKIINYKKVIIIFLKSIKFSFPVIFNALIFLIIMHFAKVYSYNFLSVDDMTKVSFLIRIMLVIQISHGIFVNYFYKSFFGKNLKMINYKLILNYCLMIFGSGIMLILTYPFILNVFNLNYEIDLIFIFIFSYTLIWCLSAFLEQYLNKFHKNKFILFYSLFALVIYLTVIFTFTEIDMLTRISMAMLASILVYFVLILKKVSSIIYEK